jgi:hypothetical protein
MEEFERRAGETMDNLVPAQNYSSEMVELLKAILERLEHIEENTSRT